jgi:hypothetical protein
VLTVVRNFSFAASTKTIENKPLVNERDVHRPTRTSLAGYQASSSADRLVQPNPQILQPLAVSNPAIADNVPTNIYAPSTLAVPMARGNSRQSMVPRPRYSRASAAVGSGGFQGFGALGTGATGAGNGAKENQAAAGRIGLTDKELDERVG